MRILANENLAATVIRELRRRGHDVLSAKESMRAQPDEVVLARARDEARVVITHDKDFGELTFRWGLPVEAGVVLFRLSGANPDQDNQRVVGVIESRSDWPGHFAVATDDRVRMRPLPPRESRADD